MVEDMWKASDIILDADNFVGVEYTSDDGKEIEKPNTIEVLLVKTGQLAEMATVEAGLSSYQSIVGGDIQAAYYFDEPVGLICNEEGKINGMELNRAVKDENGQIIDIIAGDFFICGLGEEDFVSLQPEYRDKFEKMFKNPEAFLKMGKGIMSIPIEPKMKAKPKTAEPKSHEQEL